MSCFDIYLKLGLPYSSNSKEFACNTGDLGSIPGSGRSSGEGNGNQIQYSFFLFSFIYFSIEAYLLYIILLFSIKL